MVRMISIFRMTDMMRRVVGRELRTVDMVAFMCCCWCVAMVVELVIFLFLFLFLFLLNLFVSTFACACGCGNARVSYANWLRLRVRVVSLWRLFVFAGLSSLRGNVNRWSLYHRQMAVFPWRQAMKYLSVWNFKVHFQKPENDLEHHDYLHGASPCWTRWGVTGTGMFMTGM